LAKSIFNEDFSLPTQQGWVWRLNGEDIIMANRPFLAEHITQNKFQVGIVGIKLELVISKQAKLSSLSFAYLQYLIP